MARTPQKAPDLSHLAVAGNRIAVRVRPRARRAGLECRDDGLIHVQVTAPPEDGKANAAVRKLLARHLGLPPSRLRLVAGASSRDKVFQIDD